MTRKQLRSLLESFQIDPSFIIVVSDVDQASIQCHNQKLKKETVQKLKEHHFNLMYHNNGSQVRMVRIPDKILCHLFL